MAKKFMVVKATTRPDKSIAVDGKEMSFGQRNGAMQIVDAGLAKEIDARYGKRGGEMPGSVVVVPVESSRRGLSFSVPELPWKKAE